MRGRSKQTECPKLSQPLIYRRRANAGLVAVHLDRHSKVCLWRKRVVLGSGPLAAADVLGLGHAIGDRRWHGQIAVQLERMLAARCETPGGIARNRAHVVDLEQVGAAVR
jgi:hypothetical protein